MNCTLRVAFCFVCLLSLTSLSAQHFEWASSGSDIYAGYSKSCMTADGHLITAGKYEHPTSYIPGSGLPVLHSGNGEDFSFENYSSQVFVTSFGTQGQIEWVFGSKRLTRDAELLGVAPDKNGNVIVAFQTDTYIDFDFKMKSNGSWKQYSSADYTPGELTDREMTFFLVIDKDGKTGEIIGSVDFQGESWNDFLATPDGGFAVAYSDDLKSLNAKGHQIQTGYHFTVKLNADFTKAWDHKAKILAPTCCSYYIPSVLIAVAPDGDIFTAGNYNFGISLDGSKDHMIVPFYETGEYKNPYEHYIARLSKDGKLKWVRYSAGKSLVKAIQVAGNQVIVGGTMQLQKDFLGLNIDTSEAKHAFMAALKSDGKPVWIKNFNAASVESICSDAAGGIFASFENTRYRGAIPLKIGRDTIPNSFLGVVVAAFKADGEYKWFKSSHAMLTRNTRPALLSDACGNLYFVGEMWFTLSASMNIFDAALIKGHGYGGAPLAAKIRTTIPDELIAINKNLMVKVPIKTKVPEPKPRNQQTAGRSGTSATDSATSGSRGSLNDSTINGRSQAVCMAIPFPWTLGIFPNPSAGPVTIRIQISYADDKVSIELWDAKGAFIKRIIDPAFAAAGVTEISEDFSELAKGLYFVVLKGSSSAASERMVLVN